MSDNNETAIQVSNVSKSFKLPHEKNNSIKSIFVNPFRKRTFEKQEVLKNIDFEIKKGEFFGIVGRNGSGKSTLLKLLAGIYSPDKGHIYVNGKLTPFIELGVGFNPELTGRENVYLNGALLGFNRKEMNVMYDEIVEFAELEKFMDQKLKNYSSGMQVRLAFSIAIRAKSDILVLDEVLAVGDANFQQKCFDYFQMLKATKQTVILVSHDRNAIAKYCKRCLLIEDGDMISLGEPNEVLRQYEDALMMNSGLVADEGQVKDKNVKELSLNRPIDIQNIGINTPKNDRYFIINEQINIVIEYVVKTKLDNPIFGFIIKNRYDESVVIVNNRSKKIKSGTLRPGDKINLRYKFKNILGGGQYTIHVASASADGGLVYNERSISNFFRVESTEDTDSVIRYEDKMILEVNNEKK